MKNDAKSRWNSLHKDQRAVEISLSSLPENPRPKRGQRLESRALQFLRRKNTLEMNKIGQRLSTEKEGMPLPITPSRALKQQAGMTFLSD